MTRPSQAWAYHEIRDRGLLSRLRFLVYEAIYENPPDITSGELDRLMSSSLQSWTRSASPRLNELVRLGVIEELPERKCSVTGMTVIAYRVSGELPDNSKLKKRESRLQRARALLRRCNRALIPSDLRSEIQDFLEETRSPKGVM